ncbi:MAG: EF-Tu/IF-2/RF-3 family GTPase [Thermoplasmata archaeon]
MAPSLTVALLGSKDVAKELGKKGTSSDITLYNTVQDGHAVTVVEPTQFPEKFAPLLMSLAMADRAILVVPSLTREIAEAVATLDLFDDRPIEVVLGSGVGQEEIQRAFKGTRLVHAPMAPLDLPRLREEIAGWSAPERPGPAMVRIDHAFPVKGVGAVALGVVRQGVLRAHEKLRLFPDSKVVEVRSIQVHDVDVTEATSGARVGVAIKGAEADELGRGRVLAPEGSLTTGSTLNGRAWTKCPYYRGPVGEGQQVNVLVGLQFVPASISALDGANLRLETDRPVVYAPGDPIYLADLSATTGPRIVGRATL